MTFKTFIDECRKKDVLKLISIYVVSTWVMLQVLSVTWQPLGLPEKSVTVLIILLLAGFPIYLFYIWKFRLHISEERMEEFQEKKAAKKSAFKKTYFGVLLTVSVLSILAITMIVKTNFFSNSLAPLEIVDASDKIAVLKFGNNTGDTSFDVVGKMAADWIVHGINEKQVAQVISPETLSTYMELNDIGTNSEKVTLTKYLNPSKIISGNFFLDSGKLVLQASVQSSAFSKTLISFKPQRCDSGDPLDCIENLKQRVVSYLFLENKTDDLKLQTSPPKFDAYENVIEAKASYNDPQRYIYLLEKAIAQDPTYFEPKVLRVAYYYDQQEYAKADSLFRSISPNSYKNKRQLNLLNHYEALLSGQNDKIYSTIKSEYTIAPFDLQTNASMMAVAQQFVNRPQDVTAIFEEIDMSDFDLEQCVFCRNRTYVQALAEIELGNYEKAIAITQPIYETDDLFLDPWIAAQIRSGHNDVVRDFIKTYGSVSNTPGDADILLYIAQEYKRLGNQEMVMQITDRLLEFAIIDHPTLHEALYLRGAFKEMVTRKKEVSESERSIFSTMATLAIAFIKTGDADKAKALINQVDANRAQYQYGAVDYALARYYAGIENREMAMDYLQKAVQAGAFFTSQTFGNDPYFSAYKDDQDFIKITTYWYD